nr:MAG TPA: hypothetical protein [Caudoviricetes sp.]
MHLRTSVLVLPLELMMRRCISWVLILTVLSLEKFTLVLLRATR